LAISTNAWNRYLQACKLCSQYDIAEETFKEMINIGIADEISYNTMIAIYIKNRKVDRARTLVNDMKNKGLNVDIWTYNTLISGLGELKNYEEMYLIYNDALSLGLKPDTATLNTLASCSLRQGNIEKAEAYLNEINTNGLIPDQVTEMHWISVYCRSRRKEDAWKVWEQRLSKRYKVKPQALYSTIVELARAGYTEYAKAVADHTVRYGLRLSNNVLAVLAEMEKKLRTTSSQ